MVEQKRSTPKNIQQETVMADTLDIGSAAKIQKALTRDGKIIVVKVFPRDMEAEALREAAVMERVRQKRHVLPLEGTGRRESSLYLKLPFARTTLDKRLRSKELPPMKERVQIITDLAEALEDAHAEGVIHGDVKPSNVFFRDQLELGDWGNAMDIQTKTPQFNTKKGFRVGTVAYAGPEIHDENGSPSPQYDTYGAAVISYELFTRRSPFVAETLLDLAMKHTYSQPPLFESILPSMDTVTEALEDPVKEGLTKDPKKRPSAGEFGANIRAVYERAKVVEAKQRTILALK